MASMNEIHEETFTVRTWDVDGCDGLSMAAAFNYCQEIAGIHANELGVGMDSMREKGAAWILSRMSLELSRRPGWGKTLRCRTWPRGAERLFVYRDYEIEDDAGIFARGRSAWLVLDIAKKRPLRPESWIESLPLNANRAALDGGASAVGELVDSAPCGERRAAYSDIDYNKHVNNARYIQWVQDCLSFDELSSWPAMRCDINYLSEVKEGELIALHRAPSSGGWAVEGRKGEAPAFRACIRPLSV